MIKGIAAVLAFTTLFGLAGRMDRDDARRQEAQIACERNVAPYVGIEAQCIDDYYTMKGWDK